MNQPYVKLEIFIPEEFVEVLRNNLSKIGVGIIGNYDNCLAYYKVKGYWRPLPGSEPYGGEIGKISAGEEIKVEINCLEELISKAIEVIKEVHPYEFPLVNIIKLENHLYYPFD